MNSAGRSANPLHRQDSTPRYVAASPTGGAGPRRGRGCATRGVVAAAMAALLGGCGFVLPDRIHYEFAPETDAVCVDCGAGDGAMVGLALSGGGSRASVFAAAVIEALAEQGLADRVTHISSVSGGGFAASYFATRPLSAACPAETADAAACRSGYFAGFQEVMREDYAGAMILNQFASPGRLTSPTRRATSLQEALDARYLEGATFGSLPPRPIMLFNAASYDDGRRFVFSNTVIPEGRLDYAPLSHDALRTSSFSLPDCPQRTPSEIPLSLAVVASAAFPPVIGPVTVQAQKSCADPTPQYWHLGDGGIIDNTGVDTLREMAVRGVHEGGLSSALIFVADAGAGMDPEGSRASRDLSIFTSNPGAVVDVAQLRGNAYAELFWERERETIGVPFDAIVFRFDQAEIADWPASCAAERQSGQEIIAYVARIPTLLEISPCNADLIAAAARELVQRQLRDSADVLRRHGLVPGEALAANGRTR